MILPQVHLRNGEFSCGREVLHFPPEGGLDYILSLEETRHHLVCEQHPRRTEAWLRVARSERSAREFLPYPSSLARPHSARRQFIVGVPPCLVSRGTIARFPAI